MKRRTIAIGSSLAFLLAGMLWQPNEATAQSMVNYQAVPPFVATAVTPNVLLLLDKSGSMGKRAYCDLSSGASDYSSCPAFDEKLTYVGIFDSMKCYTYDATDTRFEVSATAKGAPAVGDPAVSGKCASADWDGNFLNWVTTRRIDSVKLALIGGSCAVARNSDGTCPPSGSPAKVTIKGVNKNVYSSGRTVSTPGLPTGSGPKKSNGRVPSAVEGSASTLYFHVMGGDGGSGWLTGSFCVSNSTTKPNETGSCDNWNGSTTADQETYVIRAAWDFEQRGLIQEAGARVRFGLMQFKGNDGGFVTVPIGSKQTIAWNGTTVTTRDNNTAAMIHSIEEVDNQGNTPLAETLFEATRYIAQVDSYVFPDASYNTYVYPLAFTPGKAMGTYGTGSMGSGGAGEIDVLTGTESCPSGYLTGACGRDPFFYGSDHTPEWAKPSAQVPCCKTFIIFLTDGAPTEDQTIPSALWDFGHVSNGGHGTHCQGVGCNGHRDDYGSGSHYLDDVAYWAHITDLRAPELRVKSAPGVSPAVDVKLDNGRDLPGFQNVTVYTFFAFGNDDGRELLMEAAKLGAFSDIACDRSTSTTAANTYCDRPDKQEEYDKVNNNTGLDGADGIPDAYFESATGNDMKDKLLTAVASILQRSSSGTSISVLATSSTGEGALYQAFFFPSAVEGLNEVKWLGYLQGLFVDAFGNIREDTNGDGKLIYTQDTIIRSWFDAATNEVKVDRYTDTDGNGKADSATPSGTVTLKDIVGIWEAGARLANRDPATRKILTWVDTDNDGKVDTGEQMAFSTGNSATLGPYLRAQSPPSLYTADNIINYVRGTDITGLRGRQLTVGGSLKTWKLGDLIHSTPVVVGAPKERFDVLYGDASYTAFFTRYKTRRQVAYAGANDGMLHAFNAGYFHKGDDPSTTSVVEHGWFTRTPTDNSSGPLLGDELWGFIPYQLLPHLQWLADPSYPHVYYVDLKPKVTDARIFTPDTDHPNGWGTILIGGFRMGGSCKNCTTTTGAPEMVVNIGGTDRYFYSAYFVLDITNPEVDPKLLWSFTDIDLGLTTSYPAVVRVSALTNATTDNTNAKWIIVVGSGPTGYTADSGQEGRLFALEMPKPYVAGSSLAVTSFKSGSSNSFMGDLITLDANLDYRSDAVYAGSVINNGSSPKWAGKMFRLTMGTTAPLGGQTTVASWGYGNKPTVVLADFACTPTPCSGATKAGPIPAAPAVAADDANKIWLFFGTGRYYSDPDKSNTETQYLFGVKDPVVTGGCTQTSDLSCQRNDLVNVSGATVCVVCSGATTQVTGVTGATTLATLQGLVQSKDGWYTTLLPASGPPVGERALAAPVVLAGIVFFPSFVPDTNVCTASGTGYLYALFYQTGSAYKESVIGTEVVGSNTNVKRSTSLGAGLQSQMAVHMGAGGSDTAGTAGGGGCQGGVTVYSQSSTGSLNKLCSRTAGSYYSRYVSWMNQRL